jgi:hypothetical protein
VPKKSRLPKSLTLAETTALLGISRQSVATHVAAGLIEKTGQDAYGLSSITSGYLAGLRRAASASGGSGLSAERAGLAKARTRKMELEVAILEGRFLPVEALEKAGLALATRTRAKLLAIPGKAAARVGMCKGVVEVQALLKREVESALQELSSYTWKSSDFGEFDDDKS